MNIKRVTVGFLSILIFNISNISASEVSGTINNISSFTLPPKQLSIKSSYNKINDTIDIFDIKESELGSDASKYGSLGDSTGFDLSLGYGINNYISIYYDYENLDMKYIGSSLNNNKNDIFLRLNISNHPSNFFNSVSLDVGYSRNSADDLNIKNVSTLNSLFKKVKPDSNIFIKDDKVTISMDDTLIRLLDKDGKPIAPYISIGNLSDNSLYFRFLAGIRKGRSILDFYTGLKYVDINGEISLEPSSNNIIKDKVYQFAKSDISRNEKQALIGLSYKVEVGSFLFDFNYEYNRIFGRDIVNDNNHNNIINASLSTVVTKNLLIFVGGKLMLNQFNGVIPYLYNEYTAHKYDKKYGYMKVGFLYNFDTSEFFNKKMGF